MAQPTIDPAAIANDLERARADFYRLLHMAGDEEWSAPTSGTRWTNEQLLFHMVFGYMVVQRLLVLVAILGRSPQPLSRGFARLLDAATRPFHEINYYGTCLAAIVYNRRRMGAKMGRLIDALQRSLARSDESALRRAMYFPTRWDPYFHDSMTLASVYRYPGQHYDHHRQQLTLAGLAPTISRTEATMRKPTVLFLCTHNAGRSQMAMGFFAHLAGDQAAVYSGGSEPADEVNPAAIAAMAEKGIDIIAEQPKRWTPDMLDAADVVVTMGCGDTCPVLPGRRYEEWLLPDPAGQPVEAVRPIRDEIEQRVRTLLAELGVTAKGGG
jgi:protein-tyrosine-phosphatase